MRPHLWGANELWSWAHWGILCASPVVPFSLEQMFNPIPSRLIPCVSPLPFFPIIFLYYSLQLLSECVLQSTHFLHTNFQPCLSWSFNTWSVIPQAQLTFLENTSLWQTFAVLTNFSYFLLSVYKDKISKGNF